MQLSIIPHEDAFFDFGFGIVQKQIIRFSFK